MDGSERRKKSRLWVVAVVTLMVVVVVGVLAFVVLYRSGANNQSGTLQLTDSKGDVVVSVGSGYPGMIDVVGGSLGANNTVLNVTIVVAEPVSVLGDGEWAQWNVTVILENSTDTLNVYTVSVQLNSTGLTGFIQPVGEQNVTACQVSFKGNVLTVLASAQELPNTKTVEWSILSAYEKNVGDQLVASASDIAPDEGLQQTVLNP
jgi:hypothetical protein